MASKLLKTHGCGSGGVNELATALPADTLSFALAKVPLGSGSLRREKTVLLNVAGSGCTGIKRAKVNAKKADVVKVLGEVSMQLTYDAESEVTLDKVLSDVSRFIGSDSGDVASLAAIKEQYEAMIAKNKAAAASGGGGAGSDGPVALTRKTAADFNVKGADALKAVREPTGPFNWALFRPTEGKDDLSGFHNAGSLSVPEMLKHLVDDEILCGLVRMGFGVGRFRRTKWVYIYWSGPKVGAVKRAKAMAARAAMKTKLGATSVDIEASDAADVSLTAIIDKVKRAAVVDGDGVDSSSAEAYSVEAFLKALEEEAKMNAAFFGDSGDVLAGGGAGGPAGNGRAVEEVLKELQTAECPTNWAIFTVNL